MSNLVSQQYFWGCRLDTIHPEDQWSLPENQESVLRVTQVVLGENPSNDRHLIKVRTKGHAQREFDLALFNLQLGKTEQLTTDFYFTSDTTFHLATGTGPVYLSGYHTVVPGGADSSSGGMPMPISMGFAGDHTSMKEEVGGNSLKRLHSESEDGSSMTSIPKNMKLIKMTRQSICSNIKMDPRNPEGLTDLWVGNVHPDVTDDVLRELFGRYGHVVSCHVMPKKYCAFVNYSTKESAGKAMGALQNNKFYGVPLVIKFPEKRTGAYSGIGGGPPPGNLTTNLNDMFHQEIYSSALMNAVAASTNNPNPGSSSTGGGGGTSSYF